MNLHTQARGGFSTGSKIIPERDSLTPCNSERPLESRITTVQ